jgi:N-acetyl-anhydromuramyl-L-alanine amidase AmpD
VEDVWNMFMQPNSRDVSANFLVAQDGRVFEAVNPDSGRAWTSGSGPNGSISPDHSAITFEVMDEVGAPYWTISAKAAEAVAQVMAWAAKRYGFQLVRGSTVRGHRELPGQSTACPGAMPMDDITNRANEILAGPKPLTEEEELGQVLDQVLQRIAAAESKIVNAVQRENRPRVYQINKPGDSRHTMAAAIDVDQGYWHTYGSAAELERDKAQSRVAPELLQVSPEEFDDLLADAKARLAQLTNDKE